MMIHPATLVTTAIEMRAGDPTVSSVGSGLG